MRFSNADAQPACGGQISSLFRWPRAGDEDIHQSPGALLPVRAGRHIGDPDKSPKEIEGVKVSANLAVLDSALHEGVNRPRDLSSGTFIQP